jgi:hypothetical protein
MDFEVCHSNVTNLDNPEWTDDYREGFVDGLKRAKELTDERN